jgi:predicted PurR-regulated permease PerM
MSKEITLFRQKVFVASGIILLIIVLVFILTKATWVFLLIFASIIVAVVFRGLANLISRKLPVPTKLSLAMVIFLTFFIIVGTAFLLGPSIAEGMDNLSKRLPESFKELESYLISLPMGERLIDNIRNSDFMQEDNLAVQVWGFFSTAVGALIGILIILILSLYLTFDTKLYTFHGIVKLFPHAKRDKVIEIMNAMAKALRWWVLGQFGSMFIIGVLTWIGLTILGVPLAFTLGLLAGILTFVPNIGPIAAAVPTLLLALSVSPTTALYVAILYTFLQNLEGYFITPMIEKKAVSLPPALLITFQILMGVLLGAFGLILAAPLLVVVMVAIQILYVQETLDDDVKVLGE